MQSDHEGHEEHEGLSGLDWCDPSLRFITEVRFASRGLGRNRKDASLAKEPCGAQQRGEHGAGEFDVS
jgi:hypothetical protein